MTLEQGFLTGIVIGAVFCLAISIIVKKLSDPRPMYDIDEAIKRVAKKTEGEIVG